MKIACPRCMPPGDPCCPYCGGTYEVVSMEPAALDSLESNLPNSAGDIGCDAAEVIRQLRARLAEAEAKLRTAEQRVDTWRNEVACLYQTLQVIELAHPNITVAEMRDIAKRATVEYGQRLIARTALEKRHE